MAGLHVVIAEKTVGVDEAVKRLEQYPPRTPEIYDFPGPGNPTAISAREIARTRAVSSRISVVQGDWFIELAASAPWTPGFDDLRDADPEQVGGLYDSMLHLYNHFESNAPRGVNVAKISKVLHLKRPTQFPILDSHLWETYAKAAVRQAAVHPSRGQRRLYWAAVRADLIESSDALADLRRRMAAHPSVNVRAIQAVSDLRLLDMLTW